jgi:hypothetical protein
MRYNNDPMNEEVKDPAVDQAVAAPAEPIETAPEAKPEEAVEANPEAKPEADAEIRTGEGE